MATSSLCQLGSVTVLDIGRGALDDWRNTCSVEGEDVVTASKRWRRRGAGVYERPKDVFRDGDIAMHQARSGRPERLCDVQRGGG